MKQTKRSTFKLLIYLKKNEPKNGKVAIMGRITIDGKAASFSAKLEIAPNNWDLKHGSRVLEFVLFCAKVVTAKPMVRVSAQKVLKRFFIALFIRLFRYKEDLITCL